MKEFLFKTKHLAFRPVSMDDLPFWQKLYGDPEVTQYLQSSQGGDDPVQQQLKSAVDNIKNGIPTFVIFTTDNEFVGRAGFARMESGEIEVSYILHKHFWGRGFATEALKALLDWAKDNIDAEYIIAYTPLEHHASQRVMQKCGMEHYKDDKDKSGDCRYYRKKNR